MINEDPRMELAEQGVHLSRKEQARLVAKMLVNICGESKAGTFINMYIA